MDTEALRYWATFLALQALIAITSLSLGRFLYNGYVVRKKFKNLQAQGIPMLPHSWLLGHLPMLMQFGKRRPADMNALHITNFLIETYPELSPGHGDKPIPPALYLDTIIGPLTNGEDLLSSRGEFWKFWRPRFNPGFRPKVQQALIPEILEETAVFLDVMERRAGTGDGWGKVYPLEDDTISLTFDVVARAIFNARLNEQSGKISAFRSALMQQGRFMEMGLNPLQIFHPINPVRQWRLYRNERVMRTFLRAAVQGRKRDKASSAKQFILDPVLDAREQDLSKKDAEAGQLSDAEYLHGVVQNLKMILFAGHDTTATTICRCYDLLERHPESMVRLRAEHDAVFGPDAAAAADKLREQPQLLNSVPYTTAVVKEALRLHPPGMTIRAGRRGFFLQKPGLPPLPTEDFVLWDGVQGVHRNPEFWPRPGEFLPERFTVPEGDPLHPPKNAWRAFEHPPRSCIGQDLAMMEIKLVLVLVSRLYEIRVAWDEWDRLHPGKKETVNGERLYATGATTVHLKDGMPVQVRRLPGSG